MFDAPLECQAVALVDNPGGKPGRLPLRAPYLAGRIHCDPIVFWSISRHICRENAENPKFTDMGVLLRTRRRGQTDWQGVMAIENFCRRNLPYRVLGHNDWIRIKQEKE